MKQIMQQTNHDYSFQNNNNNNLTNKQTNKNKKKKKRQQKTFSMKSEKFL